MDRKEVVLSGFVVYGEEFEVFRGYVVVKEGVIREIGADEGGVDAAFEGIILPAFVNAHTHIGDSVAKEPPDMPLADLVGPGGFKHRVLAETPAEVLVEAMRETIQEMFHTGTLVFADFREGGVAGVLALKEAARLAEVPVHAKILGRPLGEEDASSVLDVADGVGMSSVADHPRELLEFLAEEARKRRKIFAIHAGERSEEDVSAALDLHPTFVVHLVHASPAHLKRMQEEGISAVVCVRSNLVTGVDLPPLREMLKNSLNVCIGTDNVMLNCVDMFREMEFVSKIFRIEEREVLRMSTLNPASVFGAGEWAVEEGKKANMLVLRFSPNLRGLNERNLVRGIVRRASRNDIAAILCGGSVSVFPHSTPSTYSH